MKNDNGKLLGFGALSAMLLVLGASSGYAVDPSAPDWMPSHDPFESQGNQVQQSKFAPTHFREAALESNHPIPAVLHIDRSDSLSPSFATVQIKQVTGQVATEKGFIPVSDTPLRISKSVSIRPEEDLAPYINRITQSIDEQWNQAGQATTTEKPIQVVFRVQPDGSINDVRLSTVSGNHRSDQAALAAIRNAAPFAPIPQSLEAMGELEMKYNFSHTLPPSETQIASAAGERHLEGKASVQQVGNLQGTIEMNDATRWPELNNNTPQVLTVFVNTHPQKKGVYYPIYNEYVKEALHKWSQASDGRVRFEMVNQSQNADIRVHWVDSLTGEKGRRFSNEFSTLSPGDMIQRADIRIQTRNTPYNATRTPESLIKTSVLREIGSAMGLPYSHDLDGIMCGMTKITCTQSMVSQGNPGYEPKLTPTDVAALKRLYQLEPQPFNPTRVIVSDPVPPANMKAFFQVLNRQIKSQWQPASFLPHNQVVVRIKLDQSGQLLTSQITESSRISAVDQMALESVKMAAPFSPLPKDYSGDTMTIDFSFKQ